LGLDWELPPLGSPPSESSAESPLDVELRLDLSSLIQRGDYFLDNQDYRRAIADFEEALARDPGQPSISRRLATIFTNGPIAVRDLGRASELVHMALRLDATNLAYRGDLGIVLYRKGCYAQAVESLELALGAHSDSVDRARWRIFLAISQHYLGRSRFAQESYHQARIDLGNAKLPPYTAEEFARLWAEADAALHAEGANR
jgi:tetratricopeptide (TPR) repeat protein